MDDRIFVVEPPLAPSELAQRNDPTTHISITHSFLRPVIRREWVLGSFDGAYGYAEKRVVEKTDESKLELRVPGELDVLALTQAILKELDRQRGN